jgi:hypothetical protein
MNRKMKNNKVWLITRVKKFLLKVYHIKRGLLIIVIINLAGSSFSQKVDGDKDFSHFNCAVAVTNNGISFIPTFTLGKPAVIFDLSMGKRLSFDPQFRFALAGKPWSFVFWWRYKLIKSDKFLFTVGAHPAFAFKTITISTDDVSKEIIMTQRYLAGELSPNYFVAKNISIGMYYLYGHCLEEDAIKNTHFLTLNVNFSSIKLPNQFYMRFIPQIYYLKMDENDGFYFTSSLTLARRDFPITVSALINKTIQTEISASKNFVWNASLTYTFSKKYTKV